MENILQQRISKLQEYYELTENCYLLKEGYTNGTYIKVVTIKKMMQFTDFLLRH